MRPRQLVVAATAVAIAATAAPSLALGDSRQASTTGPGVPTVQLVECSTGKRASDRYAIYRGSMSPLQTFAPSAQGMRMSFRLGERIGRGIWRPVPAPGLGVWHTALPGVAQFAYSQKIDALQVGTSYRVTVYFEWLDGQGKPVVHGQRRSTACRQPGKLPNLHPHGESSIKPGPTPDTERYRFQARNTGLAVARGVEVRLTVDGAEVDLKTIGSLLSRESRGVTFVGPVCKQVVKFEVDPRDRMRELYEKDNVWRIPCSRYIR